MTTVYETRDWSWETDGDFDGDYIETRSVHVGSGPSAGRSKLVMDFRVDGELVTIWPPAVLLRHFREELQRRSKDEFEPGERIQIRPKGKHPDKGYWLFEDTVFEHGAPKPNTRQLFEAFAPADEEEDEDGVPF
jgi:hypothetical protein